MLTIVAHLRIQSLIYIAIQASNKSIDTLYLMMLCIP